MFKVIWSLLEWRQYNILQIEQSGDINTVRNMTTQPGKINYRKSKVKILVVSAGLSINANNFYI